MTEEKKPPHLHLDVSPEVRALIRAAAKERSNVMTGLPLRIVDWAVPVLVKAALRQLGYKSLQEWLSKQKEDKIH